MDPGYRFEPVTHGEAEIETTSCLLREVFPHATHLTPAFLHWKYAQSPDGAAIGCNAWLGDEMVGHMTAEPMRAMVDGREVPGLYMQNGAVGLPHRGRKLQSRISARIFEDAIAGGYRFCLGTGNRFSTGPLLTRFRMMRPLEARLGFGRPVRRVARPSPSLERIWSDEALRWRLNNPERSYFVRNGLLLARTGVPGIAAILHDRVDLAETEAAPPGPLRLWLGLDPGIDWRRSAFVPIPMRLRPSPLNLVFRDLSGEGLDPDPDRVVFRAADFDPY